MTSACRPFTAWRHPAAVLCAVALLAPGPARADSCSTLVFGAPSAFPTGAGTAPSAVAVGDFDKNGTLDLAVANAASSTFGILLGNGAGALAAATLWGTASSPVDIVAGDIDRDGRLDLVVASGTAANQVQVHQGLAGGAFMTGIPFGVGVVPTRLALADFDRDGRLDLVVVSESSHRVRVFQGQGTLIFGATLADLDLSPSSSGPTAAVAGDFNRDGNLDLAVALGAAGQVAIFVGNGTGALGAGPTVAVGTNPRDIFAGRIDRDGLLDLVTANGGSGDVSVLKGTGGGGFAPQTPVAGLGQPSRVALADLDRDGVLDLVVLDLAAPRLVTFRGNPASPSLFGTTPFPAPLPASSAPQGLVTGDFTSDGRADLVTVLSATNQAVVVKGDSGSTCVQSSFEAARSFAAGDGPVAVAAADFDEDGRADLVAAAGTGSAISFLKGTPAGYGPPVGYPVSPAPRGVASADFNFDGHADVVAALGTIGSGKVQVYLGDGTGLLVAGFSANVGNDLAAVAVGDFNGDGAPDVAVASEATDEVLVLLGNGAGGFGAPISTSVDDAPRAIVTGDFDGVGLKDLAVACSGSNTVRVLLASGSGTFTAGSTPNVGTEPWGIAAADLDGDTRTDIVTANHGANTVSVLKGTGTGTFAAAVSYSVDTYPTGVALLRVDNTARPDIVVSTASIHTVNILLDDGSGGFTFTLPEGRIPVRSSPQAVVPVDVDLDGRLDVVVPCRTSDSVVVLLTRPPSFQGAPRVAVGSQPQGATAADLDGDGDLDLAVTSTGGNSVSLLANNGSGTFTALAGSPLPLAAGAAPAAVVSADFDRDGILDLAVTDVGAGGVSVLRGLGGGAYAGYVSFLAGSQPDDLAAADVDRDGRVDLLVTNEVAGTVTLLRNTTTVAGFITFAAPDVLRGRGEAHRALRGRLQPGRLARFRGVGRPAHRCRQAHRPLRGRAGVLLRPGDSPPQRRRQPPVRDRRRLRRGRGHRPRDGRLPHRHHLHLREPGRLVLHDPHPDPGPRPHRLRHRAGPESRREERPGGGRHEPQGAPGQGLAGPGQPLRGRGGLPGRPVAGLRGRGGLEPRRLARRRRRERRVERRVDLPEQRVRGAPARGDPAARRLRDHGAVPAASAGDGARRGGQPGRLRRRHGEPGDRPGHRRPGRDPGRPGPAAALGRRGRVHEPLDRSARPALPAPVLARGRADRGEPQLHPWRAARDPGPDVVLPLDLRDLRHGGQLRRVRLDADAPGAPPFAYTPTVTLAEPPLTVGSYVLGLSARVDGCLASTSRTIWYSSWQKTTLAIDGLSTVCVDCIGGTVKPADEGGGAVTSRLWGYRTVTGGAITNLPGETGETYAVKGTDFPGPGVYYLVVSSTLTCSAFVPPQVSQELVITVSAAVSTNEVQFLAVSSRGAAATGENRLLWVNSTGTPEKVRIRWNKAPGGTSACVSPLDPVAGTVSGEWDIDNPPPDTKGQYLHTPLEVNTAYCYSVFVRKSGSWAPGRIVKARPFDASGPVKWAFSTGATAVVPPVIGKYGTLAVSNDRTVHAITRGSAGGVWPTLWVPRSLSGVAHSRSPIVPFGSASVVFPTKTVLFAADDTGDVHSLDAETGTPQWATPARPSANATITGAPGAILTQYAGVRDLVLVGTRNTNPSNPSDFFGLDVATGATLSVFDGVGTLGPVSGTPAIDYGAQRVYFASRKRVGLGDTVWALNVNIIAPVLTAAWSRDYGEFDTSPVLRGGRLYLGNIAGLVHSIDAATGDGLRTFTPAPLDGPVKGFVFPDRRNDDIIFATGTKVWSVSDDGTPAMTKNWEWTVAGLTPSVVLYWPQTNYVYVGGGDGKLWQLDFTYATAHPSFAKSLTLGDGTGQIGAPTLDIGVNPKLLVVGSESGVLYGVEVPFP